MSAIKGLDSLMRKLDALGGDVQNALAQAVMETAEVAAADARTLAPANSMSQADGAGGGSLRSSIATEKKTLPDGSEARVFTNAPHAGFVEFGTGPVGAGNHAGISPHVSPSYTTRKSWVYPTVIKGEETFVTTSGQPARPYLYPAAAANKETFVSLAKLKLKNAIRKAGG